MVKRLLVFGVGIALLAGAFAWICRRAPEREMGPREEVVLVRSLPVHLQLLGGKLTVKSLKRSTGGRLALECRINDPSSSQECYIKPEFPVIRTASGKLLETGTLSYSSPPAPVTDIQCEAPCPKPERTLDLNLAFYKQRESKWAELVFDVKPSDFPLSRQVGGWQMTVKSACNGAFVFPHGASASYKQVPVDGQPCFVVRTRMDYPMGLDRQIGGQSDFVSLKDERGRRYELLCYCWKQSLAAERASAPSDTQMRSTTAWPQRTLAQDEWYYFTRRDPPPKKITLRTWGYLPPDPRDVVWVKLRHVPVK